MGFRRHFAKQQLSGPNCQNGAGADIPPRLTHVCLTPPPRKPTLAESGGVSALCWAPT